MLKSYLEFMNENKYDEWSTQEISHYMNEKLGLSTDSFGKMINNSKNYPEKAIDKMLIKGIKKVERKFGKETMVRMAKEAMSPENGGDYGIADGIKDLVLHHFYPNFPLGGYYAKDDEDLFIRYSYGWHLKKYGKMNLLQSFDSIHDFVKALFKDYYFEVFVISRSSGNLFTYKSLLLVLNAKDKNSTDHILTSESFEYKQHYSNKNVNGKYYTNVFEVMDETGSSVGIDDEDWKALVYKTIDKSTNNSDNLDLSGLFPIIEDRFDGEEKQKISNLIKSKTGINKFNL